MSLHVLAYNLKRVMNILGIKPLIQAMQAWGLYLPRKTGALSTSQVLSQRELLDKLPSFGRATTDNNRPDGFENVRGCLTDDH